MSICVPQVSTSLVLMLECSRLRELSTTPGPGEDASQKSRSISTVMPDVQLVSRRPSVGRLSISRPPSLEPITEARPAAVEAGETPEVLATQLVVVLKRPAATSTYGFGLAASADDKLYIYKISSNIHNWGMLQVRTARARAVQCGGRTGCDVSRQRSTRVCATRAGCGRCSRALMLRCTLHAAR